MTPNEFRTLATDTKIAKIKGERVERTFTIERDGIDEENRTAWLSISSERPYDRWWGREILDHGKKSIRDERLLNGAPLLVGHDPDDQVGVIERHEIGADKRLRILARFSKSARGEEIFRDVLDGIRRNTSVGYMIHDLDIIGREDDVDVFRVTDWEPYEGSLVSVPADPGVGVGRSVNVTIDVNPDPESLKRMLEEINMTEEVKTEPVEKTVDVAAIEKRAREIEMKRVNDLMVMGENYKKEGGVEVARELVKNPDANIETFRIAILEKMKAASAANPTPADMSRQMPENTRIEMRYRHAPLKAFRDMTLADGRKMAAEEAAYRSGQWMRAAIYGNADAARWCAERGIETRVMGGSALTTGGAVIPVEMEQAVIDLRDQYGAARRICRVRPMGSDSLQIPKRTGGLSSYFFSDTDGTGITASDKSWGQVTLNAKKLGVLARISADMVEDAVINAVDDLASECAYALGVKEDQCFIDGDGTSTYGGIQGIRTLLAGTAYVGRVLLQANHDTFEEVDATDLARVMGSVASFAKPGSVWLCSQTGKALMFDRLAAAAGGNTMSIVGGAPADSYLGYPIITSEAMPSGAATDYSSAIYFMFGNFMQSTSIGSRRGIEVQVLRERYAELGQIGVVATERFDIVTHDLGSTTAAGPVAGGYGN